MHYKNKTTDIKAGSLDFVHFIYFSQKLSNARYCSENVICTVHNATLLTLVRQGVLDTILCDEVCE
jgi:hypothetical protein